MLEKTTTLAPRDILIECAPNPAPWWVAIMWLVFLVSGAAYLIVNLMR